MGQEKTPLGQRVYSAMKRIREEILNHCSTINAFYAVYYTSALDPPVGGLNACVRVPLGYKRETPVRLSQGNKSRQRPGPNLGRA